MLKMMLCLLLLNVAEVKKRGEEKQMDSEKDVMIPEFEISE